jgi:hypothetical protein
VSSVYLQAAHRLLDGAIHDARRALVKASRPATVRRAKAIAAALGPMADDLADYFEGMAGRIRISKALDLDADDVLDWKDEAKRLREVIGRWYVTLGQDAYEAASEELAISVPWDVDQPGVREILAELGKRVTEVTDVSRKKVGRMVTAAIERGYNLDQLVNGVEDSSFGGLRALVEGWASTPQGRAGSRAALIAVTETATAYNLAGLTAYTDSGIVKVVEVFDGEGCGWLNHDDSDKANGTLRSVDEAVEHPIAHPRCQRAFGPTTEEGVAAKPKPVRTFADGDEAGRYFQKTYGDVWSGEGGTGKHGIEAAEDYTTSGYGWTNARLRGESVNDWIEFDDADEIAAAERRADFIQGELDRLMAKPGAVVQEDVYVYRGLFEEAGERSGAKLIFGTTDYASLVGKTMTEPAYMSTSVDAAMRKIAQGDIQIQLTVPKGARGLWLRPVSQIKEEAEFLLDRGARYTITNVEKIRRTDEAIEALRGAGITEDLEFAWKIEATVLPPSPAVLASGGPG